MQIRRRKGNLQKVEFLRSEYIPEKGRSVQKLIGSQDYFLTDLEPELKAKMEPSEIDEAKEYFAKKREESDAASRRIAVSDAASNIRRAAKALEKGQEVRDTDQAASIYQAMSELAKQLKRAGFPKSAVIPKNKADKTG